jgi:predicted PhzF superfamily epimerase YddE/YHI9
LASVTWSGTALAVVKEASEVRALHPDLAGIASTGTRLVIVSAPGDRPGIDCVSRAFAPNTGVPEDPVTGSAHCTLAGYWGGCLGRDELVGEQASSRGGIVRMRRTGDRVVIAGRAVTVAHTRMVHP